MPRHVNYVPHGVIPAVLLPFDNDLAIDEASFRKHLRDVASVEGLSAITVNAHSTEVGSCSFVAPGTRGSARGRGPISGQGFGLSWQNRKKSLASGARLPCTKPGVSRRPAMAARPYREPRYMPAAGALSRRRAVTFMGGLRSVANRAWQV